MKKLYKFLKPFKWAIILSLILAFFQAISDLYLPNILSDIVDVGIVRGDTNYILRMGAKMLLVAFAGGVCIVFSRLISAKVGVGFGKILRSKLFRHIESFSLHEFDAVGTASLITRTTNDVMQVQNVIIMMMRMGARAPIMAVGGTIMAVSKDSKLSLIIVAVLPLLLLVITVIAKKVIPLFKVMQKKLDKVNLVLRENLTGIRVIRAFNRDEYEKKRFESANKNLTWTSIKVNKIMAFLMPTIMLLMNVTSVSIIWFGGIRIDNGLTQVGDLMAFLQYVMQIMFSLIMLSMIFVMLPRASASIARINEVLEINPEISDPVSPKKAVGKKGYVEFDNVTFRYPGAEEPAIENISFVANPGEVTAIIGSTGSGKSTLVNLIPRFYDVEIGKVKVGGTDVREMSQGELRSRIGFVPQKVILFSGTVFENIRYGREDATMDEVEHAAKIAQAKDFIMDMKDGFNTVISQGGKNLSGGQKQRISIARALIRNPEIYIFDDSFSALDFKTDSKLRKALQNEIKKSTVIIVAQRVSTIINADKIIVLDEGKIAGMGTHKELIKSCAVYKEIVYSQLSEEEIA